MITSVTWPHTANRIYDRYMPNIPMFNIPYLSCGNIISPTTAMLLGFLFVSNTALAQEAGLFAQQDNRLAAQSPEPQAALERLLKNISTLINQGKAEQAYALLKPLEFIYAGNEHFDYLLGMAALDSGRPDMATFALERVLAVNPDHLAARLEMARAYYQLGDFQRARTEFTAILKQNPSPASKRNVEKYLEAIAEKNTGQPTKISGYLEGFVGHDNNVSYSNNESQIFIDRTNSFFLLPPGNQQDADNYYGLAAGGEFSYSLNPYWKIYVAGDVRQRQYNVLSQFDALNLDIRAGVLYDAKSNRIRMSILNGRYNLNGARFGKTTGYKVDWQYTLSPGNQLSAFAQSVQYRFAELLLQPNDVDQRSISLGWLHILAGGKSTLSGSLHYGNEQDIAPVINSPAFGILNPSGGRNDGGKRFSGLRVGGQTVVGEFTTLYTNAGAQTSNYDKVNFNFLRERNDRLHDVKIGADWQWNKFWKLRPQLSYAKNNSNINLYTYNRLEFSVALRRDFR